jgi:hypothetical protein
LLKAVRLQPELPISTSHKPALQCDGMTSQSVITRYAGEDLHLAWLISSSVWNHITCRDSIHMVGENPLLHRVAS